MQNIYTLGNGFLANHLPYPKITEKIQPDISQIQSILKKYKPTHLINCIGYCGIKNVDDCENNKEKTNLTNTILPILIANECEKLGINFIHIGSGCCFFGQSPNMSKYEMTSFGNKNSSLLDLGWKETDFANPQSYYSKSKYSADLMMENLKYTTILRIRMPISSQNNSRNLINKLKNYSNIIDLPNSMTFVDDLVNCIDYFINRNIKGGIYNIVNPEPLTAVQVMLEYCKYYPNHQFQVISEYQLDQITIAKRSNCILNTMKLNSTGFKMKNSIEALRECMKLYIQNSTLI